MTAADAATARELLEARVNLYRETVCGPDSWIRAPVHPKQEDFLLHADVLEVFFGGAGGGGKSMALWFGALQFVHVPGYAALILRRTYADLSLPSALMARSKEYLAGTDARWNEQRKTWTFPSSATITFGYLDSKDAHHRYAGSEYSYIAYDELTHFREEQYRFLFSRLRRREGMAAPLRMRSASNPGGIGHDWVRRRFVDAKTREPSAMFVPSMLIDNPSADAESYIKSLDKLDPVVRMQIKEGLWGAVESGRFRRESLRYYQTIDGTIVPDGGKPVNPSQMSIFATVDPAASAKKTADYTVIAIWGLTAANDLIWLDCVRGQWEIPDIVPQIQAACKRWKPAIVAIEGVMSNVAVLQLAQRATHPMLNCLKLDPGGLDKLVRATGAMNLVNNGRMYLPSDRRDFPLDAVLGELLSFTGDDKKDSNDDCVDVLSYSVKMITDGKITQPGIRGVLPTATGGMPSLRRQ